VIGNRFANNFNGMVYQEQGFDTGRGHVLGNSYIKELFFDSTN